MHRLVTVLMVTTGLRHGSELDDFRQDFTLQIPSSG